VTQRVDGCARAANSVSRSAEEMKDPQRSFIRGRTLAQTSRRWTEPVRGSLRPRDASLFRSASRDKRGVSCPRCHPSVDLQITAFRETSCAGRRTSHPLIQASRSPFYKSTAGTITGHSTHVCFESVPDRNSTVSIRHIGNVKCLALRTSFAPFLVSDRNTASAPRPH
jgi:hypothetical protein